MHRSKLVSLFDHLVCATEDRNRHADTERLGSLEVDVHLEFGGLLDGQLARIFAFEDAAGIDADQTESVSNVPSIAHQAASSNEFAVLVDRRHRVAGDQLAELYLLPGEKRIGADHKPARP